MKILLTFMPWGDLIKTGPANGTIIDVMAEDKRKFCQEKQVVLTVKPFNFSHNLLTGK